MSVQRYLCRTCGAKLKGNGVGGHLKNHPGHNVELLPKGEHRVGHKPSKASPVSNSLKPIVYDQGSGKIKVEVALRPASLARFSQVKEGANGRMPYSGDLGEFLDWAVADCFEARGLKVP